VAALIVKRCQAAPPRTGLPDPGATRGARKTAAPSGAGDLGYDGAMPKTDAPGLKALATNRKALFHYEVLERLEAGIALVGTEVKSVRDGGLSFSDSWVEFRAGQLFLVGCRIAPYSHGNLMNHVPDRERKLLLHKREILKLGGRATERGLTLVPLRVYLKNGRVKLEIGLARGKQTHDKREAIRRRDEERETRRALGSRREE
jgi:SsrA-binding protein